MIIPPPGNHFVVRQLDPSANSLKALFEAAYGLAEKLFVQVIQIGLAVLAQTRFAIIVRDS